MTNDARETEEHPAEVGEDYEAWRQLNAYPAGELGMLGTATDPMPPTVPVRSAGETLSIAEAIARRLAEVQAERIQLEETEKFLRDRLRALLPSGLTKAGEFAISIRANRRFSHALAADVLTPEELAACQVTTLSTSRAQSVLSPERYAACQAVTGAPVVSVK